MVEIKARGAAKAEFTNVNEHFAATNNAEFGLFQQNLSKFLGFLHFSLYGVEQIWEFPALAHKCDIQLKQVACVMLFHAITFFTGETNAPTKTWRAV